MKFCFVPRLGGRGIDPFFNGFIIFLICILVIIVILYICKEFYPRINIDIITVIYYCVIIYPKFL